MFYGNIKIAGLAEWILGQNQEEEEGAAVYENLKLEITEEYGVDWDALDELLAEIFEGE